MQRQGPSLVIPIVTVKKSNGQKLRNIFKAIFMLLVFFWDLDVKKEVNFNSFTLYVNIVNAENKLVVSNWIKSFFFFVTNFCGCFFKKDNETFIFYLLTVVKTMQFWGLSKNLFHFIVLKKYEWQLFVTISDASDAHWGMRQLVKSSHGISRHQLIEELIRNNLFAEFFMKFFGKVIVKEFIFLLRYNQRHFSRSR